MNKKGISFIKSVVIEKKSGIPKYRQLVNAVIFAVQSGTLKKNELLPSINELSFVLEIARDTVEKGYRELRKLEVIKSILGKGYHVNTNFYHGPLKVCLLFNKLSAHKKIIYDSFIRQMGSLGHTDLFVYNNDIATLSQLIDEQRNRYSHFVVIPHFNHSEYMLADILDQIPQDRLLILDKLIPKFADVCAAVYQDFENDIFMALETGIEQLRKYKTIHIVFPAEGYYPREIISGFTRFCKQYDFDFSLINRIEIADISSGEVFITLIEEDLVTLIEKILQARLRIGRDVGVISYNDTPIKRIILDGITTVSTDFFQLGSESAKMILEGRIEQYKVPFYLNQRNSI